MSGRHYIYERDGQDPVAENSAVDGPSDDSDVFEQAPAAPARFTVAAEHNGWRLDRVIAASLPSVSRSRIQTWIESGGARINSSGGRTRDRVYQGDLVEIELQEPPELAAFTPEPMDLQIVHEDDALIVLDKPPGRVVHPGAGNWSGTLLNGLLAHQPGLSGVSRAGIVHRLDAGTSGLMVVAKTPAVQLDLVRQLQQRQVVREYWAVVTGVAPSAGVIDAALARDPRNPLRFRVSARTDARQARTHFRRIAVSQSAVAQIGTSLSWLACRLDTGRTHQIRVHLESIGHPLLGDPLYSRHRPTVRGAALALTRQALHACRLSLKHPQSGRSMSWFRAPPEDLGALMRSVGFEAQRPIDVFDPGVTG
jgi:23S rRNA pseudouridine1911/1915/1917 synthase